MKKIIPYGDRILVRRRKIGEKLGSGAIIAPDTTAERLTEIAEVVYVPDHSFSDKALITNSEQIIESLITKSKSGDSEALIALLRFNEFLKIKTLQPGDIVFIGKYVGTDFNVQETGETLSIVGTEGIYGLVIETKT